MAPARERIALRAVLILHDGCYALLKELFIDSDVRRHQCRCLLLFNKWEFIWTLGVHLNCIWSMDCAFNLRFDLVLYSMLELCLEDYFLFR